MNSEQLASLRRVVAAHLGGGRAYAPPETILAGIPTEARGVRVDGFDRSIWELVEHIRLDQREVLDMGVVEGYRMLEPHELWPDTPQPTDDAAWDASVGTLLADLDDARRVALDDRIDLLAVVPHGTTATWLGKLLVLADHNTYHFGQIVAIRKLLGVWHSAA